MLTSCTELKQEDMRPFEVMSCKSFLNWLFLFVQSDSPFSMKVKDSGAKEGSWQQCSFEVTVGCPICLILSYFHDSNSRNECVIYPKTIGLPAAKGLVEAQTPHPNNTPCPLFFLFHSFLVLLLWRSDLKHIIKQDSRVYQFRVCNASERPTSPISGLLTDLSDNRRSYQHLFASNIVDHVYSYTNY